MKTVLQDLIEEINKIRSQESDVLSEESAYHPNDVRQARLIFNTCQKVINKVREFIPKEKTQIIEAHEAGRNDRHNDFSREGQGYYEDVYSVQ